MPQVYILGEIVAVESPIDSDLPISVSFALVPGNSSWNVRNGSDFGETSCSIVDETEGIAVLNQHIDVTYDTTSSEGWPCLVMEAWQIYEGSERKFMGCGSIWIPSSGSNHNLDVVLWRPVLSTALLDEILAPMNPDLKALRELTMSPYLRSQTKVMNVGLIIVNLNIVTHGFEKYGVSL